MDAPGISIFAGAGSLHLNSSAQERLDEQEELEDQERRNKELKQNLDTGFDDLADDDEPSSVNSSHDLEATRSRLPASLTPASHPPKVRNPPTYIESLNHLKEGYNSALRHEPSVQSEFGCYSDSNEDPRIRYSPCGAGDAEENVFYPNDYRGHPGNHHNGIAAYEKQLLDYEQLQVMYDMRGKECQQLAEDAVACKRQAEAETNALRAELEAVCRERNQTQLTLQQTQRQLANNKHQSTELQQEARSEHERAERLASELHTATRALQDAQQRLQANYRDREETEHLREDLDKVKKQLTEKEREVLELIRRCGSLERGKAEAAAELAAAQARQAGDAVMHAQLKELGSKLERTAQELVLSRKDQARSRQELDEWKKHLQQLFQDVLPEPIYPGSPSASKLSALKEMIARYKQQEHQIQQLADDANAKESKLEAMHQKEKDLQLEVEEKKNIAMELTSRIAAMNKQLESLEQQNRELSNQIEGLKARRRSLERTDAELDRLSSQHKETLRENGELKSLYLQACSARDAMSRELQDVRTKLNSIHKERDAACERERALSEQVEQERQQIVRLTKEAETRKKESEEVNKKMAEQHKEYTSKQKELADKLYKYIKDESVAVATSAEPETCAACDQRAKTIERLEAQVQQYIIKNESQGCNELLLKELRNKAEYFEQYIVERFRKLQEQRHVSTNTEPVTNGHGDVLSDKKTDTLSDKEIDELEDKQEAGDDKQDEFFASKTDMMMKEKQMREQLAQQFTLEIKTIEMNNNKKLNEIQKETSATITKLKELLETKAQEVEVLKKFVLSERSKMTEIMQAKESEVLSLTQERRKLQEEYRDLREKAGDMKQMLEKSHLKNAKIKANLEKRTMELEREKERASKALEEMAEQLRSLDAKAAHIETQHEQLKDKYRNVKKTALVYKEYATKKDAHVDSELERIKSHYEAEVARLHEKLQRLVKKRREIQVNERISKMQSDFDAMVSEVNSAT